MLDDNIKFDRPIKDIWKVTFGFGKIYGFGVWKGRRHKGVDLSTTNKLYLFGIGMPICAPADGFWEKVGYDEKGGFFVKIKHLNSFESVFYHLNGYTFVEGWTKIKKGDVILDIGAYIGTFTVKALVATGKRGRVKSPSFFFVYPISLLR